MLGTLTLVMAVQIQQRNEVLNIRRKELQTKLAEDVSRLMYIK